MSAIYCKAIPRRLDGFPNFLLGLLSMSDMVLPRTRKGFRVSSRAKGGRLPFENSDIFKKIHNLVDISLGKWGNSSETIRRPFLCYLF